MNKQIFLVVLFFLVAAPKIVHAEDIFQQDAGFDGVVSIEAEHFNTNLGQGGKTWNSTTKTGQSGTNVMQAMANTGVTVDTNITTTSPRLDYKINFKKTGTHYIWVRGSGATTADDSVHAGFNGAAVTTADKISSFTTALGWSKTTLDASAPATVNVTTVGQHTLNIWMREDGLVIDKIVVTKNANYVPSGTGPQESIGGVPPATAAVLNNPTINDNNVTLSWNAVSGATGYKVKYSTTAGGKGTKDYTVNSGCVAGWKLNEISGNFADACGTNTGTIVGTVNRGAVGKYIKAAEFLGIPGGGNSGNSAYVNVGSAAVVDNLRAKTITAWVKPQSLGYDNAGRVLSKDYQYGWVFRLASNNKIAFSQAFTGGTVTWTTVNAVVLTNTYQHVAVSYAGTGISNVPIIYFNGVPQAVTASGTPYGSYANDAAYNLTMGIEYTAYQFHGLMDEVAMFNRVLTQAEIQEVMAHGLDGRQGETYETVINAGNVTQYTVNNLPRGATYYLVVTALNQYGEGINSNEKNAFIVPADYVRNVDYNAAGQITKVEYGNGTITTYTYDPLNLRLTRLKTTDAQSLVIQDLSYTYDSVGNIRAITDAIHSDSQTFKYDALNRLTEATGDNYTTKTYAYDQIGNITSKEGISYTYGQNGAGPHAVTSLSNNTTMAYDSNGNMVSRNKAGVITTYEYDVENRLLKVKEGASTIEEYEYDGDGGRTKKTTYPVAGGVEVTKFVGSLYEETGSRITKHLFLGGKRVASITNNEIIFIHENHLGSANIITDDAGLIKELIEYEPYGKFARHEKYGSSEEVAWYYFTGQRLDERTGLYYYNARYYDPQLGRFITADDIVQNPYDPQSLNRYSYVGNNPINRVDPTGHKWSWGKFFKAVAIAIVGTVLTVMSGGTLAPVIGTYWAGVAGGALAGATIGGTFAAATGGNIGMGLLTGAVGGAVFAGLAPGLNILSGGLARGITLGGAAGPLTSGVSMASNFTAGFLGGAASGAAVAGVNGTDVGNGALMGGAIAGGFSLLSDTAYLLRTKMIESSRLDPQGHNKSGISSGIRGDNFKLAGDRYNSWDLKAGPSPLGGHQGGQGKIFGFNYPPRGIVNHVFESWAGPHDWLNGWTYDSVGNLRNLNLFQRGINTFTNPLNVAIAAPLAVPLAIEPIGYSAPSIIYGESRRN